MARLLVTSSPVLADDYDDAALLLKQGNASAARTKVDAAIAANKNNARARFLKGLILTEQGDTKAAIDVFKSLTHDFPELPEPYNNLAVLYAAQGQYEKARESLQMAIRTHPSYAVAHENLGDVYAKMASEAYDKALSLDSSNQTAQTKLSLIRELFSETAQPAVVAAAAGQNSTPAARLGKRVDRRLSATLLQPLLRQWDQPATVVEQKTRSQRSKIVDQGRHFRYLDHSLSWRFFSCGSQLHTGLRK